MQYLSSSVMKLTLPSDPTWYTRSNTSPGWGLPRTQRSDEQKLLMIQHLQEASRRVSLSKRRLKSYNEVEADFRRYERHIQRSSSVAVFIHGSAQSLESKVMDCSRGLVHLTKRCSFPFRRQRTVLLLSILPLLRSKPHMQTFTRLHNHVGELSVSVKHIAIMGKDTSESLAAKFRNCQKRKEAPASRRMS